MTEAPKPGFANWLGSMWLYTVLRIALFLVLWGIVVAAGLPALLGAIVAAVLSAPLSYVLLARPRARLAANIEARMAARRDERAALDADLRGDDDDRADA
jgi:peptidoglycan/LPS O-acetylase OafA/YrhL